MNKNFIKNTSCDKVVTNAKATFILESPHKDEITKEPCSPAMGESGKIMSEVLLGEKEPIGKLNNNPYSLINTFNKPLQLDKELNSLNSEIKLLDEKRISEYKISLIKIFQKYHDVILEQEYKTRFLFAINQSEKYNKVIICGLIAQTFFEYIFQIGNSKFLEAFPVDIQENTTISVFYTGHPSPKSQGDYWKNERNINKLKKFLK